jgi:small ligand-binding sensory domain FIST
MTSHPATGFAFAAAGSTAPRLDEALGAAAAGALAELGGSADLAVVFVSAAHGAAIRPAMEGLGDLLPVPAVIGATAEGLLVGDTEHEAGPAVTVWLARLPGATVVPFALAHEHTPDGGTFIGWPAALEQPWPEGAGLLLLADPFSFPVEGLIARLAEDQPRAAIVGGMASAGRRPGGNTLVVGGQSYDRGAVGVVIGGGARIRPVVSQGCRPIGRPLVVTNCEENVILELGGRPALERLREVYTELDDTDRALVRSSLHVGRVASEYQERFGHGDFLVRNVIGADADSGAIVVGDAVRRGQTVQFHVRDAASAHDDLGRLLDRAAADLARPTGALVFTCNGRGRRLFPAAHHDARLVQERLGAVAAAGFFAQGEIGPIGSRNCLHGFTASIALVGPA